MDGRRALEELWESRARGRPRALGLPEPARRWRDHALAPGPLAHAARLAMHGEIRLGRWRRFTAEEVLHVERGLVWCARVRLAGLPVVGFDALVDGAGEQRWKLLGLLPIVRAAGPDVTRSAAGRLAAEAVWLPALLLRSGVAWSSSGPDHARAALELHGFPLALDLELRPSGAVARVSLRRWGEHAGTFREEVFGAEVEEERTFDGATVPSRLRVGWHPGTERFEAEGEFLRVTVDQALWR